MTDNLFPALYQQMDTVVVEEEVGGTLRLLTKPPCWLHQLVTNAHETGQQILLKGHFPFLDNFLIDANEFWRRVPSQPAGSANAGKLSSGAWLETGKDGREYSLEATVFSLDGRKILSIQNLGATYQEQVATLQTARENLLSNEVLEREVRKRTAQIRIREEQIAMRLLAAAGFRDEETGAHVRRIGLYAQEIAIALSWDKQLVDDIRIAAPMHDIGKIGIPDNILLKPGKLTPEEYMVMQRHPVIGAQMLNGTDIPLLRMASDIARHHHEKWDGSGYPDKLKEAAIPQSARIVALADVYDALTHKRVYKPAVPEEEVLRYLLEQSGMHFDPELVAVFMDILPEIRHIRKEIPEDDVPWVVSMSQEEGQLPGREDEPVTRAR